jgi:hypothetical protein
MAKICPFISQPCLKEGCEMWLSTEIDTVDDKGNHGDKFNFDDCAFRIIAGRPGLAQPEEGSQNRMGNEFMTGS